MTNPIRRYVAASLQTHGEAWGLNGPIERAEVTVKATFGRITWVGAGCPEGKAK
jgi:hypothetical protein